MGFWEPMMTCCLIVNHDVLISAYHRGRKRMYHFTYSYKEKAVKSGKVYASDILKASPSNFPVKSFYSPETGDCYTFFRQGHCFTVKASDPSVSKQEIIKANVTSGTTQFALGTMYLLYDRALICRSSSSILFFKIDEENGGRWT